MNYYIFIPLSALIINVSLSVYVLGTGWGNSASRAFELFCGAAIIWELMDMILWSGVSDAAAVVIFKGMTPFSFLVPLLMMNFFYAVTGRRRGHFFYSICAAVAAAVLLLFFTDLHMAGPIIHAYWGVLAAPGPLYLPVIAIIYLLPCLYIVFLTLHTMLRSQNLILRKRLSIVLIGIVLMIVVGFGTSVILPIIFKIYDFPRLASASVVMVSISIFITLVRYKFLALSDRKISYGLLSLVTDGIIICDNSGGIVDINTVGAEILAFDRDRIRDKKIGEFLTGAYDFDSAYKDIEIIYSRGGAEKHLLLSQSIITTVNYPLGKLIIIKDITERKTSEERIKKSALEKETLLRELQHRVKNNLNIIYSLLDIEAQRVTNQNDREIFINALTRIQSMGLIYEQLYKSEELDSVHLDLYINKLTGDLKDIYSLKNSPVEITTSLAGILLDSQRTISLGLILNELIMNSIKYAFRAGAKGLITIDLKESDNWVVLEYRDNGPGIPGGVDGAGGETFGLKLIGLLVQQLSGYLTIDSAGGFSAVIRFAKE